MGFITVSISLGVLLILKKVLFSFYGDGDLGTFFELLAGYGLGGSSVALFGRVGGGIYTKCADVGADIVGKIENDLAEDSPRNPATIADNVGDNVGDIAGMGSDLFGSFAESTCACLVIMTSFDSFVDQPALLYYPLLISAVGIFSCLLVAVIFLGFKKVSKFNQIESALQNQLFLSTVLILLFLYPVTLFTFPN